MDSQPQTTHFIDTIGVAILDHHLMVAATLQRALGTEHDLRVVGQADSLSSAVHLVATKQPDVLISRPVLPDGSVIDQIPAFEAASPQTRVLFLTATPHEKLAQDAFAAGAKGMLSTCQHYDLLTDGIRRVARGEVVVTPRLLPALIARLDRRPQAALDVLTSRELDVLAAVAAGETTKEIASHLHLSTNTVRNHIAHAMTKLQARTRLEAVNEARRRGLVEPVAVW